MRWLILLLVTALPCLPQSTPKRKTSPKKSTAAVKTAPEAWPLVSLHVTGNRIYSTPQIVAASGLRIGQEASNAQFEAARERLFKTGAFESVGYKFGPSADGKGYMGTFEVVEVDQLYPMRFEDLPVSDAEIRGFLASREPLFRDRIPGTKEILDRYAAELQSFAAGKNFKDKVIARIVSDKPGELTVLFRPSTAPPSVAEVRFTGNQVVPVAELNNALGAVAIGVPFRETTIRQLLDANVRPLYEARGRMTAAFPKIEAEKAKDVDGVRVTVQVDEGPEFKFGEIRATAGVVNAKELLTIVALKPGELANFNNVDSAIDRIQQRLRAGGYMKAKTRAERNLHEKARTVDVTFISEPGPQFKMGKLKIEGLDVISEPAIRKIWTMKEGSPYNSDYPQKFLDHVSAEQYFENLRSTKFTQDVHEGAGTVDVTLIFKGGPDPEEQKKRRPPQF